jgi:hypothetical protein
MINILFLIAIIATIFCLWVLLLIDSSNENYYPDIKDLNETHH